MQEKQSINDKFESLIRVIDILTMENLRLKSENEILKRKNQNRDLRYINKEYQYENVWSKAKNYYLREGFLNTFKKMIFKLIGK